MRKFINYLFMMSFALLLGCTNDISVDDIVNAENAPALATEVYINGTRANSAPMTRAVNPKDEVGYSVPDENGNYLVFYYIRIDGNIPGEDACNFPATDYFPKTKAGKTLVSELNHGYVKADANWKSNSKFSKYIYASDGFAVQNVIVSEPTIEQLLEANQVVGDDFTGFIEHKDELHFLWYICKKQDSDHCWHIDGILTTKDRTDISQTIYGDEIAEKYPEDKFDDDKKTGDVEVDIHQQEHKDWGEIKTSIHITEVTDVEIELPIELDYICEVDDFAIRAFEYQDIVVDGTEAKWNGTVTVTVKHNDDKTVINISGITQDILDAHNGLVTVEVHSYFKNLIDEELWDRLKLSTVGVSNNSVGVIGQIHAVDDGKDGRWVDFKE